MDAGQTVWPSPAPRRHDPGCPPNVQGRGAISPGYRLGCGASCPCSSFPHRSHAGQSTPPFFRALDALTVDDGGARAGFSVGQLPTLYIERVMDAIERAVPSPQVKITVHRAARRQILRDRSPLATAAQHIHQTIDHLTHIHRALVPPRLADAISGSTNAHSSSVKSLG